MDSRFKSLSGVLLLALGAAIPAATGLAQTQTPASCAAPPSGYSSPDCAAGEAQALAGGPDVSGESFANSPFDLGEGAPAQYGSDFAINSAPNMIGDLLSNSGYLFLPNSVLPNTGGLSSIPLAGGDRRFKISENMSPLPRDRVYYAFNGFQQAAGTIEGREIDVNRHTFGGEKTFWDRTASIEVRMPVLQGLSAVQSLDGNLQNDDRVEFGNMTILPKFILSDGPGHVFSAGLGVNLPTARNASVTAVGNQQPRTLLNIHNQAVHLSPFVGLLLLPSDNTYVISYVQADFDANGNSITDGQGNRLGSLQDQNLVHFDVAVGRFLYRDSNTRLTGIAAQMEVHYTTTIQDADQVFASGQASLGNPFNRLDLLILTGGINFQFWNASWLTVGCAVPVRGSHPDSLYRVNPERPFDAEIQVLFNRYY